ncbi:DNA repair protein RecN [Flavobacterium johnsoniae]|uniref:DNA repair protein RecN n=1 Tax=Flavobacterium johnsoniae (strain ATCC 17061 / DSM 2064 / JCM 8514 / BCRC 14874 / CCUG 350202 / NBRC 14942 / NCIMB 11054 / UW101) TaxID=376686 RepID=A5FE92_FLAJ1|nr:DNA repair protein RecN [Flavobacterium johnsoniae]ABQ06479.1 DNA repair protein RecN [Flavobacterium johnsoniae UW101]OXE95198.1 DNA repair protein RecN [Flavobacterium johnsoniae UW101]WQG82230.1 DNA repair protein RecN [Flavobacterium johnsoniae UW101]SHK76855.1 DNA replication and repair protein RecN [Flavobacterium johnsoniae]
MITSLSIKNYALIEKLSIDFSKGFSIITGETGAGKSIILGAIGLVLGKRADLTSLKNKEEKCVIEAQFEISKYNLKEFFEANDLDYEDETIIRREILPSGKSRAFINDSPVNLQELQDLSLFLIDIHSQQQTQELSDETVQFKIIDAIANNNDIILSYQDLLKSYKSEKSKLNALLKKQSDSGKEQEYNTFLLNELVSAKLKSGEQAELEADFEKLNNVEIIKESIDKSLVIANEEQFGVFHNLNEIKTALQKIAPFSTEYQSLFDRITSISIEFDDVSKELQNASEKLLNDPEQLQLVSQKLQLIFNLQKKHHAGSVEELLQIQADLGNTLLELDNIEEEIETLSKAIEEKAGELDAFAAKIHQNRINAIPVLSNQLISILETLGMPNVRFNIELIPSETYFQNGKDELQFLFSANKGTDFGLLKKVASGGEMSRIMLAVKAILAQYSKLPTLIFDEIDTGVSGEIAIRMGEIMKEMSAKMQIFAITHLPQIAAKGDSHFKVSKATIDDDTQSELKLLSQNERVIEIAQMLSGAVVSDSALNHAKALLN